MSFLIAIDAPIELRFQRSKKRGRIGDGTNLEDFKTNGIELYEADATNFPSAHDKHLPK